MTLTGDYREVSAISGQLPGLLVTTGSQLKLNEGKLEGSLSNSTSGQLSFSFVANEIAEILKSHSQTASSTVEASTSQFLTAGSVASCRLSLPQRSYGIIGPHSAACQMNVPQIRVDEKRTRWTLDAVDSNALAAAMPVSKVTLVADVDPGYGEASKSVTLDCRNKTACVTSSVETGPKRK